MVHQNNQLAEPRGSRFWRYWPLVAELWIFATILGFLIIRILGSASFHHIMQRPVSR
jgi:hypothetical protein